MTKILGEIHPKVQEMFLSCTSVQRHGVDGGHYDDRGRQGLSLEARPSSTREKFFNETLPSNGVVVEDCRVSPILYFGENRLMSLVCEHEMMQTLQNDATMEQQTAAVAAPAPKGPSMG